MSEAPPNVLLKPEPAMSLQELRNAALESTSDAARELFMPAFRPRKQAVTHKVGRRSRSHRRIIDYKREGPFHRQVGVRVVAGSEMPMIQTYYKHKFLHATKGWREYHGGPVMRLPRGPQPNYHPRLVFYGGR